jgi:hypothetical protein
VLTGHEVRATQCKRSASSVVDAATIIPSTDSGVRAATQAGCSSARLSRGHGCENELKRHPEADTVAAMLGIAFDRSHFRRTVPATTSWWNKIKVSVRLSVKTVLAGAYLELVSARVRSCFSRSAWSTCSDGT